jgi:hypothetical protein
MYKKPIGAMEYASFGAPGRGVIEFTNETLKMLDDWYAWAKYVEKSQLPKAETAIARTMAMMAGGYAQKRSAGMKRAPNDTTRSWKMPVPRVTSRYFLGWRVQRVTHATYILTNDSREAYFIEYGIHRNPATGEPSPRRIRRPVLKLAVRDMLEALYASRLGHRVWSSIIIPPVGQPGRRTNLITWSQPSGVMGTQPEHFVSSAGLFTVVKDVIPTVLK